MKDWKDELEEYDDGEMKDWTYTWDHAYYNYNELVEAVEREETQENLENLVNWLERYDSDSWNGEKWTIKDEHGHDVFSIRPIYECVNEEDEEWELKGYEKTF